MVRELRQAGRDEDARALAGLRKPTAVVLAVNRAARDRPQAARDAARAAEELAKSQLSGEAEKYARARKDLESALALLAEVAVARLSREKPATEAMRRRVADLLRSATADTDAREALEQGVLQEEGDAAGFSAFAGMTAPAGKRPASPSAAGRRIGGRSKGAIASNGWKRSSRARRRLSRLPSDPSRRRNATRDKAARAVTTASERLERLQES